MIRNEKSMMIIKSFLLWRRNIRNNEAWQTDFIAETPQGCTNIPCGRNKERRVFEKRDSDLGEK